MAIAAYITQRFSTLDLRVAAAGTYVVFTALNAWGVKQAAAFELFVTLLAVAELLVFGALTLPSFDAAAFARDGLPNGPVGILACVPFAIWFYLAIEGVANAAEEARDPQRDVSFGFGAAMLTLVFLALLVFFAATGVGGWRAIVYAPGSDTPSDAPLPLALGQVVGSDSPWFSLLLGMGVLGLVASFHGILLAAARATLELGRAGYAPAWLGAIHASSGTPRVALLVNMGVGLLAIMTGHTAEIIALACFGAVTLYVVSMLAFFRLRRLEPELPRPYRVPLYPLFPAVALALAVLCALSLAFTQARIALIFLGLLGLGLSYYWTRKGRVARVG
jgi:ethanolamine permease